MNLLKNKLRTVGCAIYPAFCKDETDIWERIWEVEAPKKQSWESFGLQSLENEKPFLSEAGPVTIHHLWKLCKIRFLFHSFFNKQHLTLVSYIFILAIRICLPLFEGGGEQ